MEIYTGSMLILIGLLLILFEAVTPGLYLPAVSISLIIYGIMLSYNPSLAFPFAILSGILTIFVMYYLVYNVGKDIKIGAEKYIGRVITLSEDLNEQGYGLITIDSEKWHVKGNEPLKKGDRVKIVGIEGVSLVIEKVINNK